MKECCGCDEPQGKLTYYLTLYMIESVGKEGLKLGSIVDGLVVGSVQTLLLCEACWVHIYVDESDALRDEEMVP